MEEILEQLFNSRARAKTLKLLFRNEENEFQVNEISNRIQVDYYATRREILKLEKLGIVLSFKKRGQKVYSLNREFEFVTELRTLIMKSAPIAREKLVGKLSKLGRFKLVLISGVFINTKSSRIDFFLVGDGVREKKLETFLKDIEADVGKEIDYVLFDPDEFKYRRGMFDRFITEVLEGPKKVLVNRLGLAI